MQQRDNWGGNVYKVKSFKSRTAQTMYALIDSNSAWFVEINGTINETTKELRVVKQEVAELKREMKQEIGELR